MRTAYVMRRAPAGGFHFQNVRTGSSFSELSISFDLIAPTLKYDFIFCDISTQRPAAYTSF
jgi:hypothetical protein